MRKVGVEIEQTQKTRDLFSKIRLNGNLPSLESIFQQANMDLNIRYGEKALPIADRYLSLQQLRTLMTQNKDRVSSLTAWYAYVLIVPKIRIIADGVAYFPYGAMFDDKDSSQREGCAVAEGKYTTAEMEGPFLRTLCHELGHVFNLTHNHSQSLKIMAETGNLQAMPGWPDNFDFEFEARDRAWLASGPANYVCPGGKPFASKPSSWGSSNTAAIADADTSVELRLNSPKKHFFVGEPVQIRLGLRIKTAHKAIPTNLSAQSGHLTYRLIDPEGTQKIFRPAVHVCLDQSWTDSSGPVEILAQELLSSGAKGYTFSKTGIYKVSASMQFENCPVHSNVLEIEIRNPNSGVEQTFADCMLIPGMNLRACLGEALEDRFLDLYRCKDPFSNVIQIRRATEMVHCASSQSSLRMALQILANLSSDLSHEDRAQVAWLKAVCAKALGEEPDRWKSVWCEHLSHCRGGDGVDDQKDLLEQLLRELSEES